MLIEPSLGYKSSWRILNLLFETPRKPVSRRELFQLTKLGNAPLSRGLDRLHLANFIVLEKRGHKEFYYLNEKNEFVQLLHELWKKEQRSLRHVPYNIMVILSEFVRSLQDSYSNVVGVVLFGSQAKGTASINSDIDLAVIFEGKYSEIKIVQIERKMERQFHAKLQVHCFSQESFSAKNSLVQEIKREGIFLVKPEAFSRKPKFN